ncbi:MAG: hypothetical protein K5905_01300 [Roseibium sp.]|uniref:hypothetical protein n=1 Tax=Roseibium sp. TaxID=1936156 RepID=UPI00261D88ED|nr:hypothetical protein [Roseibium sp.]MCV0424085.1 hypothetical protein [Roseibium sp.]
MKQMTRLKLTSAGSLIAVFGFAIASISAVFLVVEGAAATPLETLPVRNILNDPGSVVSLFADNFNSMTCRIAAIGILLLLATWLWLRLLPRTSLHKPVTRRTPSACGNKIVIDRSLPRGLLRDGWWLES